jgi:hypothetical protein
MRPQVRRIKKCPLQHPISQSVDLVVISNWQDSLRHEACARATGMARATRPGTLFLSS